MRRHRLEEPDERMEIALACLEHLLRHQGGGSAAEEIMLIRQRVRATLLALGIREEDST